MRKKTPDNHTAELREAADNAVKTIANAAEQATKLLSTAAESASRVLATNAAEALKITNKNDAADHDILIVLQSRLEEIRKDIKDLKDNTTKRVDNLEASKLNIVDSYAILYKNDVEKNQLDHENRIRINETNITKIMTWGSIAILLIGAVETILVHIFK